MAGYMRRGDGGSQEEVIMVGDEEQSRRQLGNTHKWIPGSSSCYYTTLHVYTTLHYTTHHFTPLYFPCPFSTTFITGWNLQPHIHSYIFIWGNLYFCGKLDILGVLRALVRIFTKCYDYLEVLCPSRVPSTWG